MTPHDTDVKFNPHPLLSHFITSLIPNLPKMTSQTYDTTPSPEQTTKNELPIRSSANV